MLALWQGRPSSTSMPSEGITSGTQGGNAAPLAVGQGPATRPTQAKGGGKSKGVGKVRKAGVRIVGTDEFAAYDNDADMYEEAPFDVEGGDAPPSAY